VCLVSTGPGASPDTVTVALAQPVDRAHAPVPRTDAERLLFAQLYETLVGIDCEGRPVPRLAESWSSADGDRRWTFTVRSAAQFWDGAPVSARDVLHAWARPDTLLGAVVTVPEERTIVLQFDAPRPEAPRLLADPALAVSKGAPDKGWPIGTGPFWVPGASGSAQFVLAVPTAGHGAPAVRFTLLGGGDLRDALDGAADLMVTTDPAVLDYAGTRPQFVVAPLPWSRTYVMLRPATAHPEPVDLNDLWRAVRVDGRPADRFFWWWHLTGCDMPATPDTGDAPPVRRIEYDKSDPTAREIAGRLVARGVLGKGAVAAGLAPEELGRSLAAPGPWAYVVALARRPLPACRAGGPLSASFWASGAALVPLLDTRAHVIVRRGVGPLAVEWDGTLRLAPP